MKVKLQENVYISTSTKLLTCVGCAFLSNGKGMCKAPDSIYMPCRNSHQLFSHSQKSSEIFDLWKYNTMGFALMY